MSGCGGLLSASVSASASFHSFDDQSHQSQNHSLYEPAMEDKEEEEDEEEEGEGHETDETDCQCQNVESEWEWYVDAGHESGSWYGYGYGHGCRCYGGMEVVAIVMEAGRQRKH